VRVIFQTPPAPAKWKHYQTGELLDGFASFSVVAYEPGDELPLTPNGDSAAPTMSYWRSARAGRPFTVKAAGHYVGLPEVTIPEAVFAPLADDIRVEVKWHWIQKEIAS
jgi:hypothetical protein